ncbi:TadE/TadG family type IV pilus assembly protein [Roseibium marinum]|uniref:Flp pilus assembly protein TadG n=1 Tax=Roseibium marinum TaxID=281252 RepID=A0A2S3V3B1_9HYPH|nr:TadE/TadG family type IV pilus assembly protein [Roseibium marinum]POF34438.1 Flp pilus assembly protein TadG [Roseibium marinum]
MASSLRKIPVFLHGFWRDRSGVSATEFALILPFMLIILIGMTELSGAINADRKVSRIANATTDLVAQSQTLSPAELDDILALGGKILAPYPDDTLDTIISSITFDEDGDPTVDWSYDSDKGTPWPAGSAPPITLPDTVAAPLTSIVLAQSTLVYSPPFSGLLTEAFPRLATYTLQDIFYLRPRLTDKVKCPAC